MKLRLPQDSRSAYALGESVFRLVAAGAAWRLFTKDIPEQSNRAITAYLSVSSLHSASSCG